MTGKPKAIFLMGPTASGKTAAAVELAQHFPVDIISVDSALVYRGMDIGTAKPDAELLAKAPHRLIDIRDPAESYSAGDFRRDALAEMQEITAAGRIPLLVGGTILYFQALLDMDELPPADPELRRQLEQRGAQEGWAVLHQELTAKDPAAGARIHPNDSQRIQRALELIALTGQAQKGWEDGRLEDFDWQLLPVVWMPEDRAKLHAAIAQRLDEMFANDFVDEVTALRARSELNPELPAMRAVGYRQVWAHLDGEYDLDEAKARALYASRQLAKRQLTWLRRWLQRDQDAMVHLNCDNKQAMERLIAEVKRFLIQAS